MSEQQATATVVTDDHGARATPLARAIEVLRADANSHARLARLHRTRAKELHEQADQLASSEQTKP